MAFNGLKILTTTLAIIWWRHLLTLPAPCISESCIEIKIKLNFFFHTSLWCLKKFYEGLKDFKSLKAFIKHFEAPQRSVKIKIQLNFYFNKTFRNSRGGKGK